MLRKVPLEIEHYYHICNRGVEKMEIFRNNFDYFRFLRSMREFNVEKAIGSLLELEIRRRNNLEVKASGLVDIICYSLVYNHEHMILKQLQEKGISKFMHKLETGYAMYFNNKYKRSGSLFQGKFKSIHITSETQLCWLSAYVNCNVEVHKIASAEGWMWSSYLDYIGKRNGTLCKKDIVLANFQNVEEYGQYCKEVIKEAQETKRAEKEDDF